MVWRAVPPAKIREKQCMQPEEQIYVRQVDCTLRSTFSMWARFQRVAATSFSFARDTSLKRQRIVLRHPANETSWRLFRTLVTSLHTRLRSPAVFDLFVVDVTSLEIDLFIRKHDFPSVYDFFLSWTWSFANVSIHKVFSNLFVAYCYLLLILGSNYCWILLSVRFDKSTRETKRKKKNWEYFWWKRWAVVVF